MTDILGDIIAAHASLSSSQSALNASSATDQLNDAEVLERLLVAGPLPGAEFLLAGEDVIRSNVFILNLNTVAKKKKIGSLQSEALALTFVRAHTSIPVPKVRRLIPFSDHRKGVLLLERIEDGIPLAKLWPSLPAIQKFLTACTLRHYIHELRRASDAYPRRHVPGPMADTPQGCHGPAWLFGERTRGPFNSSKKLMDHYNQMYNQQFDDSEALVLTHGDLSLRNIVVDRKGKLWVVDWEWSGFYPPWFEYIATMSSAFNDNAPKSWWNHIPLVTGAWVKEKNMMGLRHF